MMTNIKNLLSSANTRRILLLTGIIVFLTIFFSSVSEYFFTAANISNISRQIAEIGIISISIGILVIAGEIDISLGSSLGLCAILFGLMLKGGIPIAAAILLILIIGGVIGAFNGFFVARFKIPGIVFTIGTMMLLRGGCYIANSGNPVNGFSKEFISFGNSMIGGIPVSFLVLILLYAVAVVLMQKTSFGIRAYSIGNNQRTSKYCGINSGNFKWILFIINGVVIALASIFLLGRLGSAEATLGTNYDLDVLTAVLIGGISIMGGKGSLIGAFLGLIVVGILRNGLNMMGISVLYQSIMLGIIIILTVAQWRKVKV